MKMLMRSFPEVVGLVLGMGDAVPRALAALVFEPAEAKVYGALLVGNVHHHNEVRAFGLSSMEWFGFSALLMGVLYAGVRIAETGARPGNAGFLLCRGLLGAVGGVLLLNVLESLATGKVTNYIGWVIGSRFTAINFGDLLLWLSLALLLPAFAGGVAQHLLAQPDGR